MIRRPFDSVEAWTDQSWPALTMATQVENSIPRMQHSNYYYQKPRQLTSALSIKQTTQLFISNTIINCRLWRQQILQYISMATQITMWDRDVKQRNMSDFIFTILKWFPVFPLPPNYAVLQKIVAYGKFSRVTCVFYPRICHYQL